MKKDKQALTTSDLSQKYGQFAMRLVPRLLTTFEEAEKTAHINNGHDDFYEKNSIAKAKLFDIPTSIEGEELVLYYEGKKQLILKEGFHEYFKLKGYEVINNPAPSLLIDASAILTEQKLTELGIPADVNIVLPSAYGNTFWIALSIFCFPAVHRGGGYRGLDMASINLVWNRHFAFLLRKII